MRSLELHNVTLYVEKSAFDPAREFHQALFGRDPVWVEAGHIACFGSAELAICVHEEEAGHPAGTRELFFWGQDLDRIQADLEATGARVPATHARDLTWPSAARATLSPNTRGTGCQLRVATAAPQLGTDDPHATRGSHEPKANVGL